MIVFKSCLKYFSSRDHVFLAFSILLLLVHFVFLAYDLSHCNEVESAVNEVIFENNYLSFTLCSNVPIKREFGAAPPVESRYQDDYNDNLNYYDEMLEFNVLMLGLPNVIKNMFFNDSVFWNVTHLTKKNEMELMSQMVKFSEKERFFYSLLPAIADGIHFEFEKESERQSYGIDYHKLLISNNIYYGNCITFNPPFSKDFVEKQEEFDVLIRNDVLQHRNGLAEQADMPWKRQILVIHPYNVEPIFDSRNVIKVPADSKTFINVAQTVYALETNCEENSKQEDEDWIQGQFFDERNYVYSYQACLASCLQNLTVEFCSCQLPHLHPINSMRLCRGCRLIPQALLDAQCGCKHPCKYLNLRFSTELSSSQFNRDEDSKFKRARYDQMLELEKKMKIRQSKADLIKQEGKSEIRIHVPRLTDKIIAESKCKFVVVLSQIGGILSLYVGVSLISLVEMFSHLASKRFKKTNAHEQNVSKYSISVSNQILNSNLMLKIFWILVLLAAGCATLAQTWTLILRYNQFPVAKQRQEMDSVEFPSVTVCSNNILTKRGDNFKIQDLMTDEQMTDYLKSLNDSLDYFFQLDELKCFNNFIKLNPLARRLSLGPSINQYVPTCYYSIQNKRINCSKMTESSIGAFGNCVTINSGILTADDHIERQIESLTMELKMTEPEFLSFLPTFASSVIIHPKGTSPNTFKFKTNLEIPPSYNIDVAFTMTVREHEAEPYPSKCVSPTSPYYQWMNMFHSHETPYLYTIQECISSCEFNRSKVRDCGDELEYEKQGRGDFPANHYVSYEHCKSGPDAPKCECRTPCREVIVETELVKSVKISYNSSEPFNISSLPSSWLTIRPKSRKTILFKEFPAIQIWTLISEIGGTIGLYVGASFLALIELKSAFIFKLLKLN